MKIVSFSKAVCVAAIIAAAGVAHASFAAPEIPAAQPTDYADFRQLAEPLRVVDIIVGLTESQVATNAATRDASPKWQAAFKARVERGIRARGDDLTDAVMQHAFPAFNHDQIARLKVLCANPGFRRYQAAKVEAMMSGGDMTAVDAMINDDPDIKAMSDADKRLLGGLLYQMYSGISAMSALLTPVYQEAFQAAAEADPQPVPAGVIPVPPVPRDPAGTAQDASLMTEGTWTYPGWDETEAAYPAQAVKDKVEGQATIYCDVSATGQLVRCVVLSESPAGYGFGAAAVALYQAHCHVDPATVPGGIKPGAHRKITTRWQLG